MTMLAAVHGVLGAHRYPQAEITAAFGRLVLGDDPDQALLDRIHRHAGVGTRHLAIPIEQYPDLDDFTKANDMFLSTALELGQQAVAGALAEAGIAADQVDLIVSTTVTGVAAPSLDARLAGRLGLRPDVKRLPLFGLGCVAGAAGIARLHDYLLGHPDEIAVLLAVELCSLTVQRDDRSMANLVGSGLFGDGAAAVVAFGATAARRLGREGPTVLTSRSRLYPGTERTMGWDVGARGLKIVLGADVPDLVTRYVGDDIRAFLSDHGLEVADIGAWVSHPGGPKVITALEQSLGTSPGAFAMTWASLAAVGNLSSASVLHILRDTLRDKPPEPGSPGLLLAMGPGFCAEMVLTRW